MPEKTHSLDAIIKFPDDLDVRFGELRTAWEFGPLVLTVRKVA